MKKLFLVAIIILLVVGGGVAVYVLSRNSAAPSSSGGQNPSGVSFSGQMPAGNTGMGASGNGSQAQASSTDFGPPPQGSTFELQTPDGVVTLNNFYQGQEVGTDTPAVFVTSTAGYATWYSRADSSFEIDLPEGSTPADRTSAEAAFIAQLGVSQADACKLSVSVDEAYDHGTEYAPLGGLSFCTSSSQSAGSQSVQVFVQ